MILNIFLNGVSLKTGKLYKLLIYSILNIVNINNLSIAYIILFNFQEINKTSNNIYLVLSYSVLMIVYVTVLIYQELIDL